MDRGHELKNQDLAAQAALYRLARKHLDTIHDELAMCENMVIGQGDVNNVVLSSKVRHWFGAEILRRVHRNYEMVDDMSNLCTLRDNKNIQKLAFAAIRDSAEAAGHGGFIMAIGRQMRFWTDADIPLACMQSTCEHVRWTGVAFPPSLTMSLLRTICNCWCTSARFGQKILDCRWCGGLGGDNLLHYLGCFKFRVP